MIKNSINIKNALSGEFIHNYEGRYDIYGEWCESHSYIHTISKNSEQKWNIPFMYTAYRCKPLKTHSNDTMYNLHKMSYNCLSLSEGSDRWDWII